MVSKRGMLAVDEIVKLILGVAVFIFILFVLFFFGKMVSNTLHEEQAKNTLDTLVFELNNLKDGQSKEVLIEGPAEWFLYSHANKLCFLPYSCLSKLTKEQLLTSEQIKAGEDNIIPLCQGLGSCSVIEEVSIPFDAIEYLNGYRISYYAQMLVGSSELVRADIFHAILIGKNTIPQTIQIRNLAGKKTIINMPSTKEPGLIKTLISKAEGLAVGSSSNLDFSGAEKEFLYSGFMTRSGEVINTPLICLCNSKKIIDCEKSGLCIISSLILDLPTSLEMPEKNVVLNVTRKSTDSFTVALIK